MFSGCGKEVKQDIEGIIFDRYKDDRVLVEIKSEDD